MNWKWFWQEGLEALGALGASEGSVVGGIDEATHGKMGIMVV